MTAYGIYCDESQFHRQVLLVIRPSLPLQVFPSHDPKKITDAELVEAVINQAQDVKWGGWYTIYFS